MKASIKFNKSRKAPEMPRDPKGMKGLGALLKYATELKAYKIEIGEISLDDHRKHNPRMTGMFGRL